MKYIVSRKLSFFLCLIMTCSAAYSQRLKVEKEDMKIKAGAKDGHAIIVVESAVKGLDVSTTIGDTIVQATSSVGKTWTVDVNLNQERAMGPQGMLNRKLVMRSPSSGQLILDVPDKNATLQQATYYYTVVLPDKFPASLSVEWLFAGATSKGFRIGYGTRYGGYVSYKWGQYIPSGVNIDEVTVDADLSNAKELGYIRESIIAGFRFGVFSYDNLRCYVLIGGGYGQYGRQWDNKQKVDGNRYFYSDYIKGFNANVAASVILWNLYTVSAGLDAIIDNGEVNLDFEIGLGIGISFKKKSFKK